MRSIERRLQRLEARFPGPEEPSEFETLLPFMSNEELAWLVDGFRCVEDPDFLVEVAAIMDRAKQRQEESLLRPVRDRGGTS